MLNGWGTVEFKIWALKSLSSHLAIGQDLTRCSFCFSFCFPYWTLTYFWKGDNCYQKLPLNKQNWEASHWQYHPFQSSTVAGNRSTTKCHQPAQIDKHRPSTRNPHQSHQATFLVREIPCKAVREDAMRSILDHTFSGAQPKNIAGVQRLKPTQSTHLVCFCQRMPFTMLIMLLGVLKKLYIDLLNLHKLSLVLKHFPFKNLDLPASDLAIYGSWAWWILFQKKNEMLSDLAI